MRALTQHVVEGDSANHQLTIQVLDGPGSGGASHHYVITGFNSASNPSDEVAAHTGVSKEAAGILFQNGPIKDAGVNGVTHEALLAILIDRMQGFQAGPYASDNNADALHHMEMALWALQERTRARIARGVEGTHTV